MASAGSGGRAAPRDEEANGEPDRSLQLMLRAIAEERSRTGLRHEISGLGEGRRRPERERAAGGSGPEGHGAAPRLAFLRCLALLDRRLELLGAESACRVFAVRTLVALATHRVVPVGFSLRPACCPALPPRCGSRGVYRGLGQRIAVRVPPGSPVGLPPNVRRV